MILGERLDYGLSPGLRELHVRLELSHGVGVTDNEKLQSRVARKQLRHLLQGGLRLRLHLGLPGVKVDPLDSDVARGLDVVPESVGVGQ